MRKTILLIAFAALSILAGCAAEPAAPKYVMKEEDRAMTALMDVKLDPGQQVVHCRSSVCYDVYTGEVVSLDDAPNGYLLISGMESSIRDGEL